MTTNRESLFDVIVIGAGAAGCVLAARLSEVPEKQVLLIEAGPDWPAGREHRDIRDPFPVSHGDPRFCWPGLTAELSATFAEGPPPISGPYAQGYGIGGSSNINGMAADRGQPADYDEWARYGLVGWRWDDVLPYFKKVERDLDYSGPLHGDCGPIPVRRVPPAEWAPFSAAVGRVLSRRGFATIADYNADLGDGISSVPMSCLPDRRISASTAYLTQHVRRRPNLTILPNTLLEKLEISEGRVTGVIARTSAGRCQFRAKETLVACGALQSPALLMRSGIGPEDQLRALGIELACALPGIGRNLQNHPAVILPFHLPLSAIQPSHQRAWQQNQLRYSSRVDQCPDHDMVLIPFNKVAWHPLGRRVGVLIINVLKSFSKGCVELMSADPTVMPQVRFNLLTDARDFERLVAGVRLALEVLADEEILRARNEVFLPNGKIVGRLSPRNSWNWLQAWAIARAFDITPLRHRLLRNAKLDVHALLSSEKVLRNFVKQCAQPVYHVCGTCRMGHAADSNAVVDSECRVFGLSGLRVVDASIFPSIPSANTHFPVLMAAEKIADRIKAQWRDEEISQATPAQALA